MREELEYDLKDYYSEARVHSQWKKNMRTLHTRHSQSLRMPSSTNNLLTSPCHINHEIFTRLYSAMCWDCSNFFSSPRILAFHVSLFKLMPHVGEVYWVPRTFLFVLHLKPHETQHRDVRCTRLTIANKWNDKTRRSRWIIWIMNEEGKKLELRKIMKSRFNASFGDQRRCALKGNETFFAFMYDNRGVRRESINF